MHCRGVSFRLMKFLLIGAVLACAGRGIVAPAGVVALGDSLADEYQFPINFSEGGDRRNSKNFVELLAELRPAQFDFGSFSTVSRGSPRNQGYEFNWAEDGSNTTDLIAKGQHTGAAGQIAAGQANLALVEIGSNDFRSLFLPGSNPQQVSATALSNTLTAVGTLLAANPAARVAVANVPDVALLPQVRLAIAQQPALAPLAAQLSALIDQYNTALAASLAVLPGNERVALVDLNGLFDSIINDPQYTVGGIAVDTLNAGDGPKHLFADVVHPGTIGSGKLANGYIAAIDQRFGENFPLLSDQELISVAVPEPTALASGLVLAPLVACLYARRRRQRAS